MCLAVLGLCGVLFAPLVSKNCKNRLTGALASPRWVSPQRRTGWDMWAAAYGFWRHSGVGHSFKAKPVHVSYYISTRICDVQEQAPEDERFGQGIPPRSIAAVSAEALASEELPPIPKNISRRPHVPSSLETTPLRGSSLSWLTPLAVALLFLQETGAGDGAAMGRVRLGALAQLGERLLCKHQVIGSIPIGSTKPQRARQFSDAEPHALRPASLLQAGLTTRLCRGGL
ncbi:hypothetical protein CMV_027844 [Castanea mollissima]|uniref:Secreted protein n=1 Tax=Castanea mollissima TaxID=60419 RepID=A0A8J4V8Z2_9ROSI|nr:hypothetical protein CMV_027844 [Castanea mollissima]